MSVKKIIFILCLALSAPSLIFSQGKPHSGIHTKPKPHTSRPPGSGIRPDCVGPGYRWVPGRMVFDKRTGKQVWIDGYCMMKQGNSIYIEGHYVVTPTGLRWVPARWVSRGNPQYKGKN